MDSVNVESAAPSDGAVPEDFDTPFLLPEDYSVFVSGDVVVNHPADGFEERTLPTVNHYLGADGGYMALYTASEEGSVYGVGDGIYVVGQIRVQGSYVERIFHPEGYGDGSDLTQDQELIDIAEQYFPAFRGEIWLGGDTGGWFGK